MNKPKITQIELDAIRIAIFQQTGRLSRIWISFGAGFLVSVISICRGLGALEFSASALALVAIAFFHWRARHTFGAVSALDRLDHFDLTPSAELLRIETDEEFLEQGIEIKRSDWPDIVKAGMREKVLRQIEPFETKVLNWISYSSAVGLLLFV